MFIPRVNFCNQPNTQNKSDNHGSLKFVLPLAAALASSPVNSSLVRDGDFADTFSKRNFETFINHKECDEEAKKLLSELQVGFDMKLVNNLMSKKTITLDAGHGGPKPRPNYANNGTKYLDRKNKKIYYEKDVNLAIAKKVCEYLKLFGTNIVMTRENDDYVWHDDRALMAQKTQSDAFISIHANANPDRRARGASVYYYMPSLQEGETKLRKINEPKENNLLAKSMYECISSVYDYKSLGVIGQDFRVLREINVKHSKDTKIPPAILLETGFMSNPEEAKLLIDPKFQDKIAKQIAKGIILYFLDKVPDDVKNQSKVKPDCSFQDLF